jgi:hypothetical protein
MDNLKVREPIIEVPNLDDKWLSENKRIAYSKKCIVVDQKQLE